MNEIERIVREMEKSVDGEAWLGPHVRAILEGIDAKTTAIRPIDGAHTIWEIVLHLTGTQKLHFKRFECDPEYITPEEDFPPMPEVAEANWQATKDLYFEQERRVRELVAGYPDEKLDEPLIAGGTSAYANFHGHIQHTLCHTAQIGLLKRMLQSVGRA